MNFLNRLFRKPKNNIQCPRCLGKGRVVNDDIRRLGQELKWQTGKCAYCNGSGRVDASMPAKIAVDTSYLVTDISQRERQKLIDGNKEAIRRGEELDRFLEDFIGQIVYSYFTKRMSRQEIAAELLAPHMDKFPDEEAYESEKAQLLDYIGRVIEKHKHLHN